MRSLIKSSLAASLLESPLAAKRSTSRSRTESSSGEKSPSMFRETSRSR
ncbi:MAG: hypothetical protein BWY88_00339 [Synergistetes bacterium ADurb.Bin520]|nr:MAG: hypothetical protein BWY88_00339 [Synergistetes bacterium ADurb.Bin520]